MGGATADARPSVDAADLPDSEVPLDALSDAGAANDAAGPTDASTNVDAAVPMDAAVPIDAGSGGAFGLTRREASPCRLPDPAPDSIVATDCYADVPSRTPAAGLIPYSVVSNLWADGTLKRRFLVMPDTTSTIGYADVGAWSLPVGAILIKEFLLETRRGDPSSVRPLETRFLVRDARGWRFAQYRWNDTGTDATLYRGGTSTFAITEPDGSTSTYTHLFPSQSDCQRCHDTTAGGTIGMRTVQMHRDFDYGGVIDDQIRALDHIGLFGTTLPGPPSTLPRMPFPDDTTAPLADRARSYLEGNCAHCHHPGGPTAATIDLRYQTSFAATMTCGVAPRSGDLGVTGAEIVTPGDHARSVLWMRMNRRDGQGMPQRGSLVVDPFGVELVGRWIDALTGCP